MSNEPNESPNGDNVEDTSNIIEDVVEEKKFNPKKSIVIPKGLTNKITEAVSGGGSVDPFMAEYDTIKADLKDFNANKNLAFKDYKAILEDYIDTNEVNTAHKMLNKYLASNFRNMLKITNLKTQIELLSTESAGSLVSGILFAVLSKLNPKEFNTFDDIAQSLPEGAISGKSIGTVETHYNKIAKLL